MNQYILSLIVLITILFTIITYISLKQMDNFYIDRPEWENNNDDSGTSLKYTISGDEYQRKKKRGTENY